MIPLRRMAAPRWAKLFAGSADVPSAPGGRPLRHRYGMWLRRKEAGVRAAERFSRADKISALPVRTPSKELPLRKSQDSPYLAAFA